MFAVEPKHQDSVVINKKESATVSQAPKLSKKDVKESKSSPPNVSEGTPEF